VYPSLCQGHVGREEKPWVIINVVKQQLHNVEKQVEVVHFDVIIYVLFFLLQYFKVDIKKEFWPS
jgi:hypothetical protein